LVTELLYAAQSEAVKALSSLADKALAALQVEFDAFKQSGLQPAP
jgi:hypothetical protein